MSENITNKFIQRIFATESDNSIHSQLHMLLDKLKHIYSYIVYVKYSEDIKTHWLIEYTVSQTERYNTMDSSTVVEEVFAILKKSHERRVSKVIGYKQPAIDIQLTLFEPLINKLAMKQVQRWPQIEYDDACQICKMTMLNLYRKGYYLHPSLVERSYNNDILVYIRKDKNKPDIVSINEVILKDNDDTRLTVGDMIPDTQAQEAAETQEYDEFVHIVFEQVKDIIVELIGERQFDQLMRDYGNKHTTSWSRKKMQQLKDKFRQMGITLASFDGYR